MEMNERGARQFSGSQISSQISHHQRAEPNKMSRLNKTLAGPQSKDQINCENRASTLPLSRFMYVPFHCQAQPLAWEPANELAAPCQLIESALSAQQMPFPGHSDWRAKGAHREAESTLRKPSDDSLCVIMRPQLNENKQTNKQTNKTPFVVTYTCVHLPFIRRFELSTSSSQIKCRK